MAGYEKTNTNVGRPTDITKKVAHCFRDLEISEANRSHGCELDMAYVKRLAESIREHGLRKKIIIVWHKKSGRWLIVAGAHRIAALKVLRGDNGMLEDGEFLVLEDTDASDENCFQISVDDDRHHRMSSLFVMILYYQRVTEKLGISQEKAAKILGIDRQTLNRLVIFAKHIEKCSEPVKADLRRTPDNEQEDGGPALTVYSIYEFVPALSKAGMTPAIVSMMERAVSERWSTRKIRRAVQRYMEKSENTDDGQVAQKAPRKLKPMTILDNAVKYLTKTEELLAEYGALGEVSKHLADAKQLLTTRLSELKPAKADKPVRGRKAKSTKALKGQVPKDDAIKTAEQAAEPGQTAPPKRKRGRPRKVAVPTPEPAPAPATEPRTQQDPAEELVHQE